MRDEAWRQFHGAKLMLFAGDQMIVLRRDHTPGIAWPGRLDFPGGGREGDETPIDCVIRETQEELGLELRQDELVEVHLRQSASGNGWYFAAHLPHGVIAQVQFGGEGAGWLTMAPSEYVSDPDAIPHFAEILSTYLAGRA